MITVSLCMIVKNEEAVLARCLDSLTGLMDEIIIVDTGSTDRTKEIAAQYTNQIYDFPWNNDFSEARNFSFSKASMDYIYAPDADEILDTTNRGRFRQLKLYLLPEIEIVQMKYHTVSEFNTVLNVKKEYRPKLFKRLRTFTWVDPVHETIRTTPVVFDSDVEILHMPQALHSKRDFSVFLHALAKDGILSEKIRNMYARELIKTGDTEDFLNAEAYFRSVLESAASEDAKKEAACVLARLYRITEKQNEFFKLTLKEMVSEPCSEICCELGFYFLSEGDYEESILWFFNAAYETESILDIRAGGDIPLNGLASCYEALLTNARNNGDIPMLTIYECELEKYKTAAAEWQIPDEN